MSDLSRLSVLVWVGLAAAAGMLIGSFGPWAKVVGLVNLSVSGTDGANDGWLVVAAAIVGGGALLLYAFRESAWALGTLLAGAGGAAVTIYDRGNLSEAASENTSELAVFQVGWGLNLAIGASISLGAVALIALLRDYSRYGTLSHVRRSTPNTPGARPGVTTATVNDISQLADLHTRGLLTEEEFRTAKERMLPGLASSAMTTGTAADIDTADAETLPPGEPMTARGVSDHWLYGVAAAVTLATVIVVALIVGFTGGDDQPTNGRNTACPPGQSLNENGYCSSG